jgi:rhodanese-related sulfurtransferase
VDVRDPDDFAKGHLPGATNLPRERWDKLEGLHKDKINVVYCYSQACHLAAAAAVEFASRGYPVMELEGGFATWKKLELEIEREPVNRLKRATGVLFHKHA